MTLGGWLAGRWLAERDAVEELHYKKQETLLVVSGISNLSTQLFRAGRQPADTFLVTSFDGEPIWLPSGNYFLKVRSGSQTMYTPVPLTGYRSGPDEDGSYVVSLRRAPKEFPPRLFADEPQFSFIPSGNVLLGDRLNPREPHDIWLTGYFISPFEVTNREFRAFVGDVEGYTNDRNWCDAGRKWKSRQSTHSTAVLPETDPDYIRFGQDDQPVTRVTWFEANAYCRWLTKKIGGSRWLFSLPTDPEWEKAARGPDNFDYALGMTISDDEVKLYNWRKNPDAPVTVVGKNQSQKLYSPNRFGLYHMTGNVTEWSQSITVPYNRDHTYVDDERNHDDTEGVRSVRGGSWYSASIAYLYNPYRDSFQPEHSNQELGFRIVARALP